MARIVPSSWQTLELAKAKVAPRIQVRYAFFQFDERRGCTAREQTDAGEIKSQRGVLSVGSMFPMMMTHGCDMKNKGNNYTEKSPEIQELRHFVREGIEGNGESSSELQCLSYPCLYPDLELNIYELTNGRIFGFEQVSWPSSVRTYQSQVEIEVLNEDQVRH